MGFEELIGQPTARQTLEKALERGQVHHAYRFEGPAGVGKRLAAQLLSRALVCETGTGCGACSSCRRAVDLSAESPHVPQHPDVLWIARGLYPANLVGAEATGIGVEQIRKVLQPRLGFPPHEGRALVVTLFDADELTIAAGNSLLKTLEEPPANTYFILHTNRPKRLLDTIRSRSLAIRFGPLPRTALVELLERDGHPAHLAEHAQGSRTRALELADPELQKARDLFVERVDEALSSGHPEAAVRLAGERPENKDELRGLLEHLRSTYCGRARRGEEPRRSAEQYTSVTRALLELERNAAPALVLESLVLRMSDRAR